MASHSSRNGNGDSAYLTKEVLNRAVRKGVKKAAADAMDTAGSVVSTKGCWLVRYHKNGRIEQIRKLDRKSTNDIARKLNKLVAQ